MSSPGGDIEMQDELAETSKPLLSPLEFEKTSRPSRGIVALTVETPTSSRPPKSPIHHSPPRWTSPEFLFYLFAFIVVVPFLVKVPIDVSQPTHPNYYLYANKLSQGWINGRQIDNSDGQYRNFRNGIPALAALSIGHLALGRGYAWWRRLRGLDTDQIPFSLGFSIVMLVGLHGTSALKIFAILSANYYISKLSPGKPAIPFVIWAFNLAVLFMNETYDGYRFGAIHPVLAWLDSFDGIYPRWHVTFNITVLRLISFGMDYHWAVLDTQSSNQHEPQFEKDRVKTAHPLEVYSLANFIAYAIYPPLYIAGPIMTFNNFMWQMRRPLSISIRSVLLYLFRFLVCLMTMELVLHYMYVVAIKDARAWMGDTPAQISLIGFWNLIIVWLKLLIPWRFFRLWSLADGIDPPENMVRCMTNNYSAAAFWRSWHRSYNLWIVRYIYIPVGGSRQALLSALLVFTFVALWHDLSFKLLTWGWLVSLFLIPEVAARHFLPPSKFGSRPWYRHACAVGCIFNILMMMSANLVGFVIGLDGIKYLFGEIFGTLNGLGFLVFACGCIFIAVQVMFEYREEELRRGIHRRY